MAAATAKRLRFVKQHSLADIIGGPQPKTRIWQVRNSAARIGLGYIRWFGAWRQYAFDPEDSLSFEKTCLRTIADFCERKTREHYAAHKRQRTNTRSGTI